MSRMGSSRAGRRARRQFSEEFRAGAVRLVLDEGKTIGAVARDLDLTPSSLANWVKHARPDRTQGKTGLTTEEPPRRAWTPWKTAQNAVSHRTHTHRHSLAEAFSLSFLPNDGVGLARLEFIIGTHIRVHPMALVRPEQIADPKERREIERLTQGYADRGQYFVDRLAEGVGMIAAAFWPKDVIVRLSDFKTNEYAGLLGGVAFEPKGENPMIGFRGASRYYDERYREGFAPECRALRKVREEMGLENVKLMVPFCRTVEEGRRVIAELAANGLVQGERGLEIYVMCEIPSNVILAKEFAEVFDGFSIGSNDLTQLVLGVDRDSELVAHLFDERNEAVKRTVAQVIGATHAAGRKIGICGQAPSDYPEFAPFLVTKGIDSLSINPDSQLKTMLEIAGLEQMLGRGGPDAERDVTPVPASATDTTSGKTLEPRT